MNEKKMQLLTHLRSNSRDKLTTISKKTNIPISTLFDMLKELQGDVITKHTSIVDFSKLGYHTHAKVFMKFDKEGKDAARKFLQFHDNVNSVYKINNGWQFMIETVHKNVRDLDQFLELLDEKYSIEKKEIHYIVEEIKKEGFSVEEFR